jgi:hypothetical protein
MPEARQLLVSLLSATTLVSSAQARRRYVPGRVVEGMVTAMDADDEADGARIGTVRAPVSRMSPVFLTLSVER